MAGSQAGRDWGSDSRPGVQQMRDTTGCPLLGAGRASWVFDLGDGTVLRRRRDLGSSEHEAGVMRWARAHGVPVPDVVEARGPDLIMERVLGPTLLDRLLADHSIATQVGQTLAALHHRLDQVPAPEGLAPRHRDLPPDAARGLLHGDLHPANVLMSAAGPVLVDWTNAGAGPRPADVAESWLILLYAEPGIGPVWPEIREQVLEAMLAGVDRAAAGKYRAQAAATRLQDPSTTEAEKRTIRALAANPGGFGSAVIRRPGEPRLSRRERRWP